MHDPDSNESAMENRIDDLEHELVIDREVISHLQADGVIEREKIANLTAALVTARRIGLAMGILMQARKISEHDAFGLLRAASQQENVKLRDVADRVALTGSLDP